MDTFDTQPQPATEDTFRLLLAEVLGQENRERLTDAIIEAWSVNLDAYVALSEVIGGDSGQKRGQ